MSDLDVKSGASEDRRNVGALIGDHAREVQKKMADELVAYLDERGMSQRDLSLDLDLAYGAANYSIRNHKNMSFEFMKRVTHRIPGFWRFRVEWAAAVCKDLGVGEGAVDEAISQEAERRDIIRKNLLEVQGLLAGLIHNL